MNIHNERTELRKAQRILAEKVVGYLGKYKNIK